jgi:DNA-binding NarL/FixJ family response regulator
VKAADRHREPAFATNGPSNSAIDPHPTFTVEESIVMRAFAAGKGDKEVCIELRIPLQSFNRLLRSLMERTGTHDRTGLQVWALQQRRSTDSRQAERSYRWRPPA